MAVYYADGLSVGRQERGGAPDCSSQVVTRSSVQRQLDGFSRLVGPVEGGGCAWDILRLHDRILVFLFEVPVPASEVARVV